MDAERFRFRDDALRTAAARTRRRFGTTLAVTGAIVAIVWATALRPRGAGWGTLAFSLGLLAALALASIGRRMRRLHQRFSSFEIALEADAISRSAAGYPPLRIARADVAAIGERPEGIVVRAQGGAALMVPRDLEGYARVREALAGWAARPGGAG